MKDLMRDYIAPLCFVLSVLMIVYLIISSGNGKQKATIDERVTALEERVAVLEERLNSDSEDERQR